MFFDKKLHITATGKHEFHVTHGKENSPLNASVALIQKPFTWFAMQIKLLVSMRATLVFNRLTFANQVTDFYMRATLAFNGLTFLLNAYGSPVL